MKTKNEKTALKIELNPASPYYRICPNSACRKPHMVTNRGRDYCSNECADKDYNQKRRLKKMAERILFKEEPGQIVPLVKTEEELKLEKNISILDSFIIPPKGIYLKKYVLSKKGFAFNTCTNKYNYVKDDVIVEDLFWIQYGPYLTFSDTYKTILIKKHKQ